MQNRPDDEISYPTQFTGSGGEYFKIWIVNILLSIVTLYVYSAWAKVRTKRYFYGNTLLDNSAFEYHAKGIQLLPGRLIGIALVAIIALGEYLSVYVVVGAYIFLFLITPWAACRSTAFHARMTSYRNVRLGFTGEVGPYYKYLFFIPLGLLLIVGAVVAAFYYTGRIDTDLALKILPAGFLLVYLLWPWMHCRLSAYSIDQTQYGTAQFDTELSPGRFYGIYLSSIALCLLMLLLPIVAVFGAAYVFNSGEAIDFEFVPAFLKTAIGGAVMLTLYIAFIALGYFASAYVSAKLRNYQFKRTLLDGKFQLSSSVQTGQLWWIEFSNLFLIIFTLGIAYPWAAVRKARYLARNTRVLSRHSADQFIADQTQAASAYGEEIGDAFDMDLAAGI